MFVGDYLPVMHHIQENGLTSEIDIVVEEQQYRPLIVLTWPTYILFSKKRTDISYVHKIDSILNEMKQDGTYDMFFHKYQNVHD
jgi:ABC-type amino acid transport substrate-binding protein